MSLLRRYRDSLKAVETEEVFDLLVYRPLAFLFVTATYSTTLTPNQVSVLSMVVGVIGGVLFGFGTQWALTLGAALYFISNVLDCADGQIARLKKNGTRIGRVVDGFIDYVVSIAVFLGIATSLAAQSRVGVVPPFAASFLGITDANSAVWYVWVLTVLAGASTAFQAFQFDLYRNKYLKYVHGKASSPETELREFEEERCRVLEKPRGVGKFVELTLIAIYLKYTRMQIRSVQSSTAAAIEPKAAHTVSPDTYARHNKMLLRLWSFTGSTTHITLTVICALLGNLELFLLLTFVPLNLLSLSLNLAQARATRRTFAD